ncbi:MAG: hypothetical protein ACKVWR_19360 [Acidimicrobiales bacterium]
MQIVDASRCEWKRYQHPREGTLEVKPLGRGSADGVNFNLTLTRYGEGSDAFATPRHHHTFEQVRVPLAGSLNYGPGEEIPEGWVAYFPAGAPYGPQRVSGGVILLLQFGEDYLSSSQYKEAHARLEARGRFEGGDYHDTDPDTGQPRTQDAVDAVWTEALGRPIRHPKPRYPAPILIDPEAFEWSPLAEDPAVEVKRLGTFTEREVSISRVRLNGGVLGLGPDRTQLVFSLTDGLEVQGAPHGAWTAVWSPTGEEGALSAASGAEALVVELPRPRR